MPSNAPGIALVVLSLVAPVVQSAAPAGYPQRPVRFIVPFAPGGGTDLVGRVFAQRVSEIWGQQVVVDNRPGASAILGAELVARSQPDGHTLLLGKIGRAHV